MRIANRRAVSIRPIYYLQCNHNIRYLHDNLTTANQDEIAILDRQILRPDRAETCQSGTDDEVARHKSPYDPTQTSVDKEVSALREEYKLEGDLLHDPLAVSPANLQVSHILQLEEERAIAGSKSLGSVRGWTSKHKTVLLRREPYAFRAYEIVFPYLGKYRKVCGPLIVSILLLTCTEEPNGSNGTCTRSLIATVLHSTFNVQQSTF